MEIELKYAIHDQETAKKIWEDETLRKIEEPGSRETVFMHAVYFDTKGFDLCDADMAYRVRSEGDKVIASLKWGGTSDGALHIREELNVPVTGMEPDPAVFKESDAGANLCGLLEGKPLYPFMETRIRRSRFRADTQKSLLELSLDSGEIITDNGTSPVCEVEIELFSGCREDMMKVGQQLADRYGLVFEKRSKFYRGLVLIGRK